MIRGFSVLELLEYSLQPCLNQGQLSYIQERNFNSIINLPSSQFNRAVPHTVITYCEFKVSCQISLNCKNALSIFVLDQYDGIFWIISISHNSMKCNESLF